MQGAWPVWAFVGLLVLAVHAAPPAAAQAEQKLRVSIESVDIHDGPLVDGRLPPETVLQVDVTFSVLFPMLTVCPFAPITVMFFSEKPFAWADQALAVLDHTHTTILYDQTQTMTVYEVPASVRVGLVTTRTVPAFQSAEFVVGALAQPSGYALTGCNVGGSDPVRASVLVTHDYAPDIEASTPAWYGTVPQPIRVTNHGNGATRVQMELGTPGGHWVPAGAEKVLESQVQSGPNAATSTDIELREDEVPTGWNREVRAMGRALQVSEEDATAVFVLSVADAGSPPPDPTGTDDAHMVPAPGLLGTVGVAGLAAFILRRRDG